MSSEQTIPECLPLPQTLRILVPIFLVFVLFVVSFFGVLLPAAEKNLMGQKRALLATLTRTGANILNFYAGEAKDGKMAEDEARQLALRQIRSLRYGPEGKDYFWINDLGPVMVMHPYRTDLEGHDVSNFTDPAGKRLFREMVDVVARAGSGFVEYRWQWQDDQKSIVPKLSHVELFRPWGWIIGTGVYLEDVRQEIAALTKKIAIVSTAILLVIAALSAFVIRQGLRETRKRLGAELELRRHQDQLEMLVVQRTADLQQALAKVKTLSGFLPICCTCKKIRDDTGSWNQIESYIRDHSEARFSHSFCPDCARTLYPEFCDGDSTSP